MIQPEPPILSDDKKREMLEKEKVWMSDPHDGFVLGRIIDLTEEGALVERVHGKRCETTVSFEQLYPCEEDEQKDVDDNCGLMYLNQVQNMWRHLWPISTTNCDFLVIIILLFVQTIRFKLQYAIIVSIKRMELNSKETI